VNLLCSSSLIQVKAEPRALIMADMFHKVPLLIGTNVNEGSLWIPKWDMNVFEYGAYVYGLFGPVIGANVLLQYPYLLYKSPAYAWMQIITDSVFACPTRFLARASSNRVNTYLYVYRHEPSWCPDPRYGVYHMAEVPYVFFLLFTVSLFLVS